jgi:hypothetical protein
MINVASWAVTTVAVAKQVRMERKRMMSRHEDGVYERENGSVSLEGRDGTFYSRGKTDMLTKFDGQPRITS